MVLSVRPAFLVLAEKGLICCCFTAVAEDVNRYSRKCQPELLYERPRKRYTEPRNQPHNRAKEREQ